LLYNFAIADTLGRTTADMGRPLENLHLWKMVAEENACFDGPFAFANDHARFLFYREQLSSLHYTPRELHRCRVTMMSGLPGAGKDTWLKTHRPELPVVSLDDIRDDLQLGATDNQGAVIQTARERCREFLRAKRDFAFNATNIMRLTRSRWIDLFADYSARIEIVYIEPPISVIFEQNKNRLERVPERVVENMLDKLDPPTWTEAHRLKWVEYKC
jgi:predicted kinase